MRKGSIPPGRGKSFPVPGPRRQGPQARSIFYAPKRISAPEEPVQALQEQNRCPPIRLITGRVRIHWLEVLSGLK